MNEARVQSIRDRLQVAFAPEYLEVEDESDLHEGHAGAASGLGHFRVTIVSSSFQEMGRMQRHRAVYAALGSMMETDIHALSVRALTADEI
jgi:BolA protein